jgi:phosphoribosylformylglycinamidine synthase
MSVNAAKITPEIVAEHGLSAEEYQTIISLIGREPNLLELGIFSVMWSEHCSYKSTRKHLRGLPTEAPWVICGPGENAGIIDIGDGDAAVFKMESHNHPSFIEPYQGAATGVGGIMRDVFTMGARPIANMNALRFGDLSHPLTRKLLSGVVSGIGGYGNCMGVPTVGGETNFHSSYNGNILVNAMTVGLVRHDKIFYSAASDIGAKVVYVGSKTGRDGIHGATMASTEFNEDSESKRPTVQVGDPFTEKLLLEACLELMATDAILSIQDMGAAGLTSSSFEMTGKGGTGIELALDCVPMRETGMTPYEIMLSESQERMLIILKPEKEEMARAIFAKWDLDFAVIGTITNTGRHILTWHGEVVSDLPVAPLSDAAPVYDRPYKIPSATTAFDNSKLKPQEKILPLLERLLASPDLCSRRWIWEQYDSQVMNDTIAGPGGDAAVVRVHGTKKALAITTDCTPRYCAADPFMGGKQAVAEAWRNLTAVGAEPLAITDNLNFGNPQKPEIMGQIVGALQGIAEACRALNFPVVSGNVSLYNETDGKAIQPTPAIGGVGLLQDSSIAVGSAIQIENETILLIGETKGHIGASLYLREIEGLEEGAPPSVDLNCEKNNGDFVRSLIRTGQLSACHDISDGGLLVALAEMIMPNGIGANVEVECENKISFAFGEDQSRYIVTCATEAADYILHEAKKRNVPCQKIGNTVGDILQFHQESISVASLKRAHEKSLPTFMGRQ